MRTDLRRVCSRHRDHLRNRSAECHGDGRPDLCGAGQARMARPRGLAGADSRLRHAQEFKSRAAYQWSVETSIYLDLARTGAVAAANSMANFFRGSPGAATGGRSPGSPSPTMRAWPFTAYSVSNPWGCTGEWAGSTAVGAMWRGCSWTWLGRRTRSTCRCPSRRSGRSHPARRPVNDLGVARNINECTGVE